MRIFLFILLLFSITLHAQWHDPDNGSSFGGDPNFTFTGLDSIPKKQSAKKPLQKTPVKKSISKPTDRKLKIYTDSTAYFRKKDSASKFTDTVSERELALYRTKVSDRQRVLDTAWIGKKPPPGPKMQAPKFVNGFYVTQTQKTTLKSKPKLKRKIVPKKK